MTCPRCFLTVVALAALAGGNLCAAHENTLMLRDAWAVQSSAKLTAQGEVLSTTPYHPEGWYPTSVPKTVLAVLADNGVYPDPYYGENLKQIAGYREGRWLRMPEDSPFYPAWWYRTEFTLPDAFKGRRLVLHIDGVNFRANVWLNGRQLASDDAVVGMFRRFEFDVDDFVRFGEPNGLALEVTGPGHLPEKDYHTKQVEATTGWDDHNPQPPDLNLGLWRDVYITATGPVALRHAYVDSDLEVPSLGSADLTVEVHCVNKTDGQVAGTLSGTIEEIAFAQEVVLEPGETKVVQFTPEAFEQLHVKNPRVWWPVDVGPQELYDCTLTFSVVGAVSDTAQTRFGIRKATSYINDEGWRVYRVNGRNILIRGGAWMTCDMLLRLDRRRYNALIRYAKEAHLNMLRSEGFSIRETEDFYDLCDEYGVMVTQQIFGRSIPDEDLAVACIEDMMLRIRTHPSLVHFLGHDETFPTKTLDAAYQELIEKHSVNRTYQPHSGAFEIENRFKTGGTRTGSLQVWTYATPGHYYTSKDTGAWGFAQSGGIGGIFASPASIRRMLPEEALWPPWQDAWSFHTVTQGAHYYNAVLKAVYDRYGRAAGFDDFIKKGLALNYECARGMFEAYGRNKFSATGITTWKYDAAWPAAQTWQYVDWYLVPTAAYYGAKKACEPLHAQYSYDDHSVWVVNNFYEDRKDLKLTARVYNLDMTEQWSKTAAVDVPANGNVSVFAVDWPEGLTKSHFLLLRLEDGGGKLVSENLYWLSTTPDIPNKLEEFFGFPKSTMDHKGLATLPAVTLNVSSDVDTPGRASVTLENPSDALAFFVHLALTQGEGGTEVAPVFWEDNYFSLFPGQRKTVSAEYYVEDLGGAAPAIHVDGWNVAR